MIRVQQFACSLPRAEADALNRTSGEVYTRTLVWHYRIFRRTGQWLSPTGGSRLEDRLGGPVALHAHSRDAAQQGFYEPARLPASSAERAWMHIIHTGASATAPPRGRTLASDFATVCCTSAGHADLHP